MHHIHWLSCVTLVAALLGARGEGRAQVHYPPPPPWKQPKALSGSIGVSGFAGIPVNQRGGQEYLEHGGGLGLDLGLYIGRFIGIRLGYDVSFHNPTDTCAANPSFVWCNQSYLLVETVHGDVLLRFPTGSRFQPLLFAGVLVGLIGRQGNPTDAVGGGFEAGGGFDVWVSRWFTLGVEAKYRGMQMGDYAGTSNSSTFLSLVSVGGNMAIRF